MRLKFSVLVSGISLFVSMSTAQAQIYKATLLGQNEIPVVTTQGTGSAIITLNRITHEMRVSANFTGLTGLSSASHVHCCVAQPGNAGVATTTPTFAGFPLGVNSGSWDRIYDMTLATSWNPAFVTANGGTTAGAETTFLNGIAAGQSYLNVHSSTFGGGEIRGNLVLFQFAANAALGTGTRGVATALDSLGAGTGKLSDTLVNLAFLTSAQQATALGKLTPTASRGKLVVTTGNFDANFDQVGSRLDGLRWADREKSGSGKRNGIWFTGHGVTGHQDQDEGFAGYKTDGWGVVGGADRRFKSGTVVGGAVGYSNSSLDYRDQSAGNSDDVTSTQLSFFVSQDIGRFYVQGAAAYAWQDYDSTRDTGGGIATGSYKGHQWGSRISGGLPIALSSNVSFTPQARLNWANVKQDAYNENGGGALGLAVAARSVDRFRGSLGAQVDFDAKLSGLKTRPFVRGFWNHDLEDKGRDTTATFLAGGTSFVTPGQKLDSDPFTLGAGANFFTQGSFSAGVNYDVTLGNSFQSHALQGRAHWTF